MWRMAWILRLALGCVLLFGTSWSEDALARASVQAVVTDARVGAHAGTTRFVLEFTDQVTARVFSLANPYRIVIDLPEVGWRLPARPLPKRVGLMERFRYGLFKPGVTRVVLETTGPAAIHDVFFLGGAKPARDYRLVVDLVSTTRAAFLRGVEAPAISVAKSPAVQPRAGRTPSLPVRFVPAPRKPEIRPRKPLIVLDPGHGGVDPGAIGAGGTREKHIVLSAAREFRTMLEKTGRYRVKMTRERDVFIPLRDRVAFAREVSADLFISIHADSIRSSRVRGLSVYTLSERASDQESAELAERENKADLIVGIDLTETAPEITNILIDLAQRETMNRSARFAAVLVKELGRETRLLRNSHRFAGFRVLKAPDVPSVLVELGFLSNRRDERDLRKKSYRLTLAKALVRAVDRYFARVEQAVLP